MCVVVFMEVAGEGKWAVDSKTYFGYRVVRLPYCMGKQHTNTNI